MLNVFTSRRKTLIDLACLFLSLMLPSPAYSFDEYPWTPAGGEYPFMRRTVTIEDSTKFMNAVLAPPRVGYYIGNGRILTSARQLRGDEPLRVKNFDGKVYEVKRGEYNLFQDASQGYKFEFRAQPFSPTAQGLVLTPKSQFAILELKDPEILEMDSLPSASLDFNSDISTEVWGAGAYLNRAGVKKRLAEQDPGTARPRRGLPIGYMDFTTAKLSEQVA